MPDSAAGKGPSVGEVGDAVHGVALVVLSFAPAAVQQAFPEGVAESKSLTFLQIFLLTAPWTLAIGLLGFLYLTHNFPSELFPALGLVAAVLCLSALLGNAIAPEAVSSASIIFEHGGPPGFIVVALILWALFNYALLYGFPLYMAGLLVGMYGAWVVATKTNTLKE